MPFTNLDLATLNPIFDKCAADAAAAMKVPSGQREAARLKAVCLAAAQAEINRQGAIYTREETAYINKIKANHVTAKGLTATLIDAAKQLDGAWDDRVFAGMAPQVTTVGTLKDEAHAELAGATAHQGWRSNQPWIFAKAIAAIGQENQDALFQLFKTHRDPMIMATGDIKTFVVKLDEFHVRALDSLKAGAACKSRTRVDATQFLEEIKALLKKAIEQKNTLTAQAKANVDILQKFVVLCNSQKTKLDPVKVKAADGYQAGKEIWLKNAKTEVKTVEVASGNAKIRAKKGAVPPQQLALVTGLFGEVDAAVLAAKKELDTVSKLLDIHKNKLAEAKTRK